MEQVRGHGGEAVNVAADGRPLVAVCYIVRDSQLLMVQRKVRRGAPEWGGPSGNVEPGETPEEAAVREVREEVGLAIEVVHRLGDRVHPASGRHLVYFACRILAGEATVIDHDEIAAVEWCDLLTALDRWADLHGGVFPPVREYLERTMGTRRHGGEPA
jgi:8-oxo-dGTP diphosphatase